MTTSLQRTESWISARLGHVTASRIADVVARTRSGPAAARANYAADLIAERMTGVPAELFVSAPMQWGIDTEPLARAAYSFHADVDVADAGFILHPRIAMSGASPDGLIGHDGLIEIKCPNTATHIDRLLGTPIADKYIVQMQWQLACTGRSWCDFVSFDPRLPESMRLSTIRVQRDPDRIEALEREVIEFLEGISKTMELLTERWDPSPATNASSSSSKPLERQSVYDLPFPPQRP